VTEPTQEALDLANRISMAENGWGDQDAALIIQAAIDKARADLRLALGWALDQLVEFEPGDSRAVSDVFVAAAAIQAGLTDRLDECRAILTNAIERGEHKEPMQDRAGEG